MLTTAMNGIKLEMASASIPVSKSAEIVVDTAGASGLPSAETIHDWVSSAMLGFSGDVFVNFVEIDQSRRLNKQYRDIDAPTNVLSFPAEMPTVLGDLAVCTAIAKTEAENQGKSLEAHLAHLVIHGVLHLCGFDHGNDADAEIMELKEVALLESIGVRNPYER